MLSVGHLNCSHCFVFFVLFCFFWWGGGVEFLLAIRIGDFHYYSLCVIVRSAVNSCLFLISVNVFFSFVRFFFIFSDSLLEFSWCLPIFSSSAAANAAKSLQSCLTLCDPIDGRPPGSPVPGILQARTLEWVAISFSNAWKWKVKVKSLSHVWFLATPWTAAHQAPPSMGISRQEYWSGLPLPSPFSSPVSIIITNYLDSVPS